MRHMGSKSEREIVVDPNSGVEYVRLPRTVAMMEVGGNWPPPPTLWQRLIRLLKKRRS
jgi:hypothetical protein